MNRRQILTALEPTELAPNEHEAGTCSICDEHRALLRGLLNHLDKPAPRFNRGAFNLRDVTGGNIRR